MLPKAHFFFGFLLVLLSWFIFPNITWFYILLIFLSSIFIDVDHYIWYVFVKKDWSLKNAYYYLKNDSIEQHQLMIFHTIEFIIIIGLFSFIWIGFYYIFIGIVYHSIFDIIDMVKHRNVMCREYSLIYHFIRKKKSI